MHSCSIIYIPRSDSIFTLSTLSLSLTAVEFAWGFEEQPLSSCSWLDFEHQVTLVSRWISAEHQASGTTMAIIAVAMYTRMRQWQHQWHH